MKIFIYENQQLVPGFQRCNTQEQAEIYEVPKNERIILSEEDAIEKFNLEIFIESLLAGISRINNDILVANVCLKPEQNDIFANYVVSITTNYDSLYKDSLTPLEVDIILDFSFEFSENKTWKYELINYSNHFDKYKFVDLVNPMFWENFFIKKIEEKKEKLKQEVIDLRKKAENINFILSLLS